MKGGMVYDLTNDVLKTCDGTNWNTVGGGGGAAGPSFHVNKAGTNQTVSSSESVITWTNDTTAPAFDSNANFAANRFTPTVAGKYLITLNTYVVSGTHQSKIYQNTTKVAESFNAASNSIVPLSIVVDMNGTTDYIEARISAPSGTVLEGLVAHTNMSGSLLGGGGGGSTTLAGLTDVDVSGIANGKVLAYNSTSSKWEATAAAGGTPAGSVAGAMQFRGSTAIFAADDINLVWDDTNNRLGIGTATPAASSILDLTSTAKGFLPPRMTTTNRDAITSPATGLTIYNTTNGQLEIYSGTTWTGVGSMTAGTIAAFAATSCPSGWTEYTAARGRFLRGIDPSGSTLVDPDGTRAPGSTQLDAFKSHVHTLGGDVPLSNIGGTQAGGNGSVRSVAGSTAAAGGAETRPVNVAVIFCSYNGAGNVPATATVSGTTNYVAKFTGTQAVGNSQIFDNGTNVGIGTTAPDAKLTAWGAITDTVGSGLLNLGAAGDRSYWTVRLDGSADFALDSYVSSWNNRFFIDRQSGNVGIGTASPSNYRLVVDPATQNSAKIGILVIGKSGNEYPSVGYNVRYGGTAGAYTYDNGDTAGMIRFQSGKVETFTAASGTAGNAISFMTGPYVALGGTTWSAGSDVRLKKNIQPITVLDKLGDFRAVSFDWKETGKHDVGVIAQEIYKAFPEVVDKGDDDLEAEITAASDGKWGVQYDKLGALALQAAKELKAENDNQDAEIRELREEIKALKAAIH